MGNFRLTAKAKTDLLHIGRATQGRWGKRQRNKYLKELDSTFHYLAEYPEAGAPCDELAIGYRKQPRGSHIIYYKASSTSSVDIIRVLHKRMDAVTHVQQL